MRSYREEHESMNAALRERIDAAAKSFERAKKSLMRPDGLTKYSLPEHNELEAVAQNDFNAALNRIGDEIEGRIASAEEKLHRMEHADPSAALTAEELEAANARRAFISDEVFNHSAEGLTDRVAAIISGGDRVAQFLYLHYLRARASESSAGEEGNIPETERYRLKELAAELEAALDPEAAGRLEKARAEIDELRKIRDYAYYRRHGAKDPVELHMNRAYGSAEEGGFIA
jgi:hypothetical protein